MKESILKIKDIVIDERIYPREKLSDLTIRDYCNAMSQGDSFPPIYVAFFQKRHILIDGRHRIEAKRFLGEQYIQARIQNNFPDMQSIFLASIRANQKHGKPLTEQDKWKVALGLKRFRIETVDISKLTRISVKRLDRVFLGKMRRLTVGEIKDKVRVKEYPAVITEKMRKKEDIELVDKKEMKRLEEENRTEWQIAELTDIHNYLKNEKFDIYNDELVKWVRNIKKIIHKKFPKA